MIKIFKKKKQQLSPYGWFGDYKDWNDVPGGYAADQILETTKTSLLKIKNGEAVYERDSVLFDKKIYPYAVISAMLYIAAKNDNHLNVVDFGGSLGSTWYQIRDFIPEQIRVNWNIVEQEAYINCGKTHFEDHVLKFHPTIEESNAAVKSNVLLLSSVIQYLEKPYEFLAGLAKFDFDYIIFDRTAFMRDNRPDRLTLQIVPPEIYEAQYPSWFLNEEKVRSYFPGYRVKAEFESFVPGEQDMLIDGRVEAYDKGFFLEKIN